MGSIRTTERRGNLVKIACDGEVIGLDLEEIYNSLGQFTRDARYFDVNYQSLAEQFPDEAVAIFKGVVVGHNKDGRELLRELSERRITGEYIGRTYVNEQPPTLILSAA